jgi:hypothetical protein
MHHQATGSFLMDVNIGVVAHHKRLPYAKDLLNELAPEAISVDNKDLGGKWNHQEVLSLLRGGNKEWSVVLEDDAIPCDDFRGQLSMALPCAPTSFVGLYLGRSRPPHWQAAISHVIASDVCWLTCDSLLNAVGYAIKTSMIPSLLDFLKLSCPERPIDDSITDFGRTKNIHFGYTKPSLVEHRDIPPVQKHSYGIPEPGRKAWIFGNRSYWDSSTVPLEYVSSW